MSLGFDLGGSLLAIADWARGMEESDESDGAEASPVPRRVATSNSILTRETIESMVRWCGYCFSAKTTVSYVNAL
jgi:hypothetical protein